jgi:hypothetical protein
MAHSAEKSDNPEYPFSQHDIESLIKTQQDFIDGKTTARDWSEIENELNNLYGDVFPDKSV